jgi:methylenetetrahydrofolate dehydrogenase (NADP+) / methenyltetrahydrofolate cyclohydrolase
MKRETVKFIKLDGAVVAKARFEEKLKPAVAQFNTKVGRKPGLAVILIGNDPASGLYVKNKIRACDEAGLASFQHTLPESATQDEVASLIQKLNVDPLVDGILLQLPVPKHIKSEVLTELIDPAKDADGLTMANLGLLFAGRTRVAPCTPFGVLKILEHYKIPLAGKTAVVVGRSNLVGKPMAQLLLNANCTVTMCHSKTEELENYTSEADIVVVAAGKPRFLGVGDFSPKTVVIDVGIHRPETGDYAGKIVGDVRYEELDDEVMAATPVPGGVGPMTIQMLLENTVMLALRRAQLRPGQ